MPELSLEEELVADLRMTRQVIEERGHTRGHLISFDDSVCMTGAAAIAVEGTKFVDYVKTSGDGAYADKYDWDSRTVRLLEALSAFSPHYGRGRRAMKRFIRSIVGYNDGAMNKEEALAWVDKALSHAEKALAEAGRMSVEEEL